MVTYVSNNVNNLDNYYFNNITLYQHDYIKNKQIYKYFLRFLEKNIMDDTITATIIIKYYLYQKDIACLYYEKKINKLDYYIFDFSNIIVATEYNSTLYSFNHYCIKSIKSTDGILSSFFIFIVVGFISCFICNYRRPEYGRYNGFNSLY